MTPQLAQGSSVYDPELDRLDLAARALWRLARKGRRDLLRRAGLTDAQITVACETAQDSDRSPTSEADILGLFRSRRDIWLWGAFRLQRAYWTVTAQARLQHLKEEMIRV